MNRVSIIYTCHILLVLKHLLIPGQIGEFKTKHTSVTERYIFNWMSHIYHFKITLIQIRSVFTVSIIA
jgi:hypothetical protein